MTGVSNDRAGIFNYTKKRDIRKCLEREIRAEGYDSFNPKPAEEALMPPTEEDITLVTSVQNQNGHRAVVVGSKTKLWRYYGLDDPNYCYDPYNLGDGYRLAGTFNLEVDADTKEPGQNYGEYTPGAFAARDVADVDPLYVEAGYYSDDVVQWQEIGSGFSGDGKRWEALNINGYLVLNNGVDLPMTYRERDSVVTPIYELRDQGIASVGSIAEHNGILICLDIRQIKDTEGALKSAVDASVEGAHEPRYSPVTDLTKFTVNSGVAGVAGNVFTYPAFSFILGHYDKEGTYIAHQVSDYFAVGDTLVLWSEDDNTFVWRTIVDVAWPGSDVDEPFELGDDLTITLDGSPLLIEGDTHYFGPYFYEVTIGSTDGLSAGNVAKFASNSDGLEAGLGLILWDGEDWVTRKLVTRIDSHSWLVDGDPALINQSSVKWYWNPGTNNNANPYPSMSPDDIRVATVKPSIETLFPQLDWALDEASVKGLHLIFDSGETIVIDGISESGEEHFFITNSEVNIAAGPVTIESKSAYGPVDDSEVDHYQWRMLWGMPNQPRRFGAAVTGTITPTSNVVKLDAPTKSFFVGQNVKVVNISATGMGNVTGTIIYLTPTELFLGGSVITNAGQTVVDKVATAKSERDLAKSVFDAAKSALEVAEQALEDATEALDADPTNEELVQAKADAAAAVAALELKVSAAQTALEDAEKALAEAEKMLEPVAVSVEGADSAESIVAFEDLIDDGSAILRGLTLRNFFIVYKETSMFIARYTGTVGQPFVFEKVPIPMSAALKFKHTLVDVGGMFHFFATNNGFCRFDLTNRVPMEIVELMACKELFFKQADVEDEPFSANNSATREVFICVPNSTHDDATIRYDYLQGTVSTSSMMMTAAATVPKPTDPSNRSLPDLWFVMGGNAGALRRYGFVDGPEIESGAIKATVAGNVVTATGDIFTEDHVGRSIRFSSGLVFAITSYTSPTVVGVLAGSAIAAPGQTFRIVNAIWHRGGEAYDSIMESGLEAFGAPQSEKMLNEYVLILASKSVGTTIGVTFLTGVNPSEITDEFEAEIDLPLTSNLIPTAIQANYLGDRITVGGVNNPVEFGSRLLKIEGIASSNFNRHP